MLFDTLPKAVQTRIISYLAAHNYIAAKSLYDAWASERASTDSDDPNLALSSVSFEPMTR